MNAEARKHFLNERELATAHALFLAINAPTDADAMKAAALAEELAAPLNAERLEQAKTMARVLTEIAAGRREALGGAA